MLKEICFNKQLFDNNIRYINDIIKEVGTYFSFDKFSESVKVNLFRV